MENKKTNREDKIIEVLCEKPAGLTVRELAKALEVSKVTMAKDLDVLVVQDKIFRREVGSAKIHYHPKWAEKFNMRA